MSAIVYIQWDVYKVLRLFLQQRNFSLYGLKDCCGLQEMQLSYVEVTWKKSAIAEAWHAAGSLTSLPHLR